MNNHSLHETSPQEMPYSGARASLPPPRHPDQGLTPPGAVVHEDKHFVTLLHPRYPDGSNTLFMLPALDPIPHPNGTFTGGEPITLGLHYDTARVACAILANCRWDGYLSKSKADGALPCTTDPDYLLPGREYYFHVPSDVSDQGMPYPTVPSFDHFKFPHNNLPPSWTTSSLAFPRSIDEPSHYSFEISVIERDKTCRLTASRIGTKVAHFVPRSQEAWFSRNNMHRYSSQQPDAIHTSTLMTNNYYNAMLIGAQLHSVYDQRQFVVVPKWGSWLIQALAAQHTGELAAVHHNVQLQPLKALAVEFIFARFAWTVFTMMSFINPGVRRRLLVYDTDGVPTTCEVLGDEYRVMFPLYLSTSTSRSQTRTPRKRMRDNESEHNGDDYDCVREDDFVWETRGRPTKRAA